MKLPRNLQRYLILPQGTFLKIKNIKFNYEKSRKYNGHG